MMRCLMVAAMAAAVAGPVAAATPENFELRNAADLLELCATPPGDGLYQAAIHACHGFGQGAWQYHLASTAANPAHAYVCIPEPRPTRDQVTAQLVVWGRAHPQYAADPAVEVLFRFFAERFPCKR